MRFAINTIELENFRQYRGRQTIHFQYNKTKNVAIIRGKNGAGKSNLLNALTWCFYGIETHTAYEDNKKMPIINTSELASLQNNERTHAEVRIYLETDHGNWTIKRTIGGGKRGCGEQYVDLESTLTVVYPDGGQDKTVTGKDTEVLINNLLPGDLKGFFFMDGEKLREFFNKDTTENIGESIEKVSQLDLMYKAAEHLEWLEKELRKRVKDSTPRLDEINSAIQKLQGDIERLKKNINRLKEEVKKDNYALKEVKDFLKNCGIEHVEYLEEERQRIEQDIRTITERLYGQQRERNNYLVKIAPFIYLKKPLQTSYNLLLEKVEKGDLPPKIKRPFVEELIEKGRCICGTDLIGEPRKTLEAYSKTLTMSEIGEVSIVGKTKIRDIVNEIQQFIPKMDTFHEHIQSLEDELASKRRRIEQIKEELDIGEDKVTIINYERRRDELGKSIGRMEQMIKGDSAELKKAEELLDLQRQEYDKELSSSERNRKLKKKLKLVQNAQKTIGKTEVTIKNKLRTQIQEDTERNFYRLIRKKEVFKKITLNENYEITVEHTSGYNVIDHLSAGEYMLLGLSFMSALMNISGFKAPVIIDTPLGRIDDEHRDTITTELPAFLEGTQLILFVTPTEYDEKVRINLDQYLLRGNYYDISENQKQDESRIVSNI